MKRVAVVSRITLCFGLLIALGSEAGSGKLPAFAGNSDGSVPRVGTIGDEGRLDGPTWSPVTPIPITNGLSQTTAVTANDGKIYLIGGGLGSGPDMRVSQLLAYDPPTDTWTSKAPVPLAAGISAYGSAIQYDGYIFVFGGITNAGADSTVLQSTLIYSIAADQWYFGTNLPEPRFGSAVGLIYGYVVVAGGGSSVIETTTWIYNTAADTYSEFQPAPMPDGFPTYRIHGVGFNDRGAGGQVHAFAGAFDGNLHFVFDVTTNMWSLGPAMPFGVTDPGVCTDGGARIFVTGGPTGQQGRLQTYNLDSRTWSQGPMMGVPVNNTACAYSGGSVYSLGGYSSALMRSIPDTFVIPVP